MKKNPVVKTKLLISFPQSSHFQIIAHCTKCNSLINKSKVLTANELVQKWDVAVLEAPQFLRCGCTSEYEQGDFNFDLALKIKHLDSGTDYAPEQLIASDTTSALKSLVENHS